MEDDLTASQKVVEDKEMIISELEQSLITSLAEKDQLQTISDLETKIAEKDSRTHISQERVTSTTTALILLRQQMTTSTTSIAVAVVWDISKNIKYAM